MFFFWPPGSSFQYCISRVSPNVVPNNFEISSFIVHFYSWFIKFQKTLLYAFTKSNLRRIISCLECLAQSVVSCVKNTLFNMHIGKRKMFWLLLIVKIVNVVVALLQKEYMLHFKRKIKHQFPNSSSSLILNIKVINLLIKFSTLMEFMITLK